MPPYRIDALVDTPGQGLRADRPGSGMSSQVSALTDPSPLTRAAQRQRDNPAPASLLEIPRTEATERMRAYALEAVQLLVSSSLVSSWKGVRFGVDTTPGSGHQGASVEAYRELRALGYRGPVQFACPDAESLGKVAALVRDTPDAQREVIGPGDRSRQPAALAICGALDGRPQSFGGEHCVILQPLHWLDERQLSGRFAPAPARPGGGIPGLERDRAAYQIERTPEAEFAPLCWRFLEAGRRQHLLDVMALVKAHKLELCTVYGKGTHTRAQTLVRGISAAQTGAPGGLKGTVVLWVQWGAERVESALPSVPCFSLADGSLLSASSSSSASASASTGLGAALGGLVTRKSGVVVLVTTGLPQAIFNGCLERSTVPPLIEGANARNFMRMLQKPYLSVAFETPAQRLELPTHLPAPATGSGGHSRASLPRRNLNPPLAPGQDPAILRDFILAARRPGSEVVTHYAGMGRQNRLATSDQLVVSLCHLHPRAPRVDMNVALIETYESLTAPELLEWLESMVRQRRANLERLILTRGTVSQLRVVLEDLLSTAGTLGFGRVSRSCSAMLGALSLGGGAEALTPLLHSFRHELTSAIQETLRLAAPE